MVPVMPLYIPIFLLSLTVVVEAFPPRIRSRALALSLLAETTGNNDNNNAPLGKGGGPPSYSDEWLLQFHNRVQTEKQFTTDSLAYWNEQQAREQASIREWQDCFLRNGFADFTPPMSTGLHCLMIGEDICTTTETKSKGGKVTTTTTATTSQRPHTKLPWEEEPAAAITSLQIVGVPQNTMTMPNQEDTPSGTTLHVKSMPTSSRNSDNTSSSSTTTTGLRVARDQAAAVYDCIVDQGVLDAILQTPSFHPQREETIRELLAEASLALREHGIYVLNSQPLSPLTMTLLEEYSQQIGLEWKFHLDGISDDRTHVSVARRFCTGAMPPVGKLSRFLK